MSTPLDDQDVGLVNCADCGYPTLGERTAAALCGVPKTRRPGAAQHALPFGQRVVIGERDAPLCRSCARRRGLLPVRIRAKQEEEK